MGAAELLRLGASLATIGAAIAEAIADDDIERAEAIFGDISPDDVVQARARVEADAQFGGDA